MYRPLQRAQTLLALASVACLWVASPSTAQVSTGALAFETEAFDLETGAVIELIDFAVDPAAGDFHFAYHADRTTHAVTFQAHGAEIARMSDTPFEYFSASDVASLTFTPDLVDQSCDGSDTVVIRTAGGSIYKIGNLLEDPAAGVVLFDYEALPGSGPTGGELPPSGLSTETWRAINRYMERDLNGAKWTAPSEPGEPVHEDAKLLASDGAIDAYFGTSVAVSGDTVVVGAEGDHDQGSHSGSAYVFEKPAGGWSGTLSQAAKLLASDGVSWDLFGTSVAVSGDTVVVGAYWDDDQGENSGSAYVFEKPVGGWSGTLNESAKLLASDGSSDDLLGYSVAVFGDTVVVGPAYVFEKPVGGWSGTLNESAKLHASDGVSGDIFGYSVAVSGDTVVVGAEGDDDLGSRSGSAYVFEKPGGGWSGTLSESAKLLASDGARQDFFGRSVAVSGDTVVVGAVDDDDQAYNSGSAYVFEKPAGGWSGTLNEDAKLLASDGASDDYFGNSVAVSGDTVVVGAYGNDDDGPGSGSAYVFEKPGGGWSGTLNEAAKLLASDGARQDWFGWPVAVSGDTVVVGARLDDDQGTSSGSAYVFELAPSNRPPMAVNDAYMRDRNVPLILAAPGVLSNDIDPDGDPLTATQFIDPTNPGGGPLAPVNTPPWNGTLALNPDGSFSYTPNLDFIGTDSFSYVANDGLLDSNVATVTITVHPVAGAPVAVHDNYATDVDLELTVAAPGVLANDIDPDGDPMTAIQVAGPSSGTLTLSTDGSFTYTPNSGFAGADSFTYKTSDGLLESNVATVTITVGPSLSFADGFESGDTSAWSNTVP